MLLNIEEIEIKYKNKLESIEEWNYLRNHYRSISNIQVNRINKFQAIKDIFYGFRNLFKRYQYIIFSDSNERKSIKKSFYDIKVDFLIEYLGKNQTLCIETPNKLHYNRKEVYTKHIMSRRFFDLLTVVMEKFSNRHYSCSVLKELNDEYNLSINYNDIISRFNSQYYIYKIYFKVVKPKYIFLNCFYDKQYVIKAAHELDIRVIDIQHGIIGNVHSAYYSLLSLSYNYLPNYLFVNGLLDKKELQKSNFFKKENIIPIGNYYLEFLRKNFLKNPDLNSILINYKLSVGVSLQWTVEKEMINMISNIASQSPDTLFILIPRIYNRKKYLSLRLPSNIIIYNKLDCYNIILHCDYHCTAYSTCALEAPSLGITNILLNIHNTTSIYMNNMFSEKNTYIVNSEQEFINILTKSYICNKENIIKSNEKHFISNYEKNIDQAIKYIKGLDCDK